MSQTQTRDLIVLGSGPGGYVAAIRAAQLGRSVTIVEKESLGGVCLNWGCIPSKALLKSAHLYSDMNHAEDFGIKLSGLNVDFPRVVTRSREVAGKLSGGVTYLMKKNKVDVIFGTGKLLKGNKLSVIDGKKNETIYNFKDIIIATGARARTIPGVDVDGEFIHTYRTILEYKKLPKKTLVIGAGAIGLEFAYFQSSFGTEVTVAEMQDQILPLEDTDIANGLQKILTKKGLTFHTGAAVQNIKRTAKGVTATIKTKTGDVNWSGDCCLIAIGVIPNTENIGLNESGITLDRGFIKVDKHMKTSIPNHYAIGDVVGAPLLAHVASHEAIIAAETTSGHSNGGMHYDNVPSCTYCQPQVASIGMTEKTVKEKGIPYRIGNIPFSAIGKAIAIGEPDGMIKVIIDKQHGEVLGVHILHSEATELISEAAIIRSHEGIASSVVDTIHPHPTLSESVMEAMALALGRPINF